MRVLLITSSLSLDPVPPGFVSVDVAESLDTAGDLASYDGVIADLRALDDVDRALSEISRRCAPLPIVAIVREAQPGSARSRARLVDETWLEPTNQVLAELLRREVTAASGEAEARRLRDRQAQLVHNEKFVAVGLLAAEIAHEINNPATFVITNLAVMMDYVDTIGAFHAAIREALSGCGVVDLSRFEQLEDQHEIKFLREDLDSLLDRSLTGLNRIHQIVQDLKYFGTDHTRTSNSVDVDSLVRAALGLVRHEARFRSELIVDLPPLPDIKTDANRLSQVILNLLVNGVQSIDAGSPTENSVTVSATVTDEAVVLSITDTGSGIPADALQHIFEPFYTTKAPGDGTGLGLAISRDIMRSLGGEIHAVSEFGLGSRFDVVIPRGELDD